MFFLASTPQTHHSSHSECNLVDVFSGEIANVETGNSLSNFFFSSAGEIESHPGDYAETTCNIVNGFLQCNADGAYIFEYCGEYFPLMIGTAVPSGCTQIQLPGDILVG